MSAVEINKQFSNILLNSENQSGRVVSHRLSFLVDSEVRKLYKTFSEKFASSENFCLVAVGGYGRRELSPHSDLDFLYVHNGLSEEELKAIINHFNNPFYDSGKEIGYSCRTIAECRESLSNLQTFNSFLDSRFLVGNDSIYEKFEREVLNSLPGHLVWEHAEYTLQRLRSLLDSSPPLHISEPNLKNGPFGLRDIQCIYWMEKADKKLSSLSGLAYLPFFHPGEMTSLESAYDFYLKVRNALHLANRRKTDILSIPLQPEVCEIMGFGKKTDINAIDNLMRTLYGHEMVIFKFIRLFLEYRSSDLSTTKKYSLENLNFSKRGNVLYPDRYRQIFTDPDNLYHDILNIFFHCQENNLEPSPILLSEIEFASNFLGENFSGSKQAIQIFRRILKNGKNLGKLLTLMHHSGVLGKLIPEFGACANFSLFSYHHQYTVDEHTLLVLRELDKLREGSFEIQDVQEIFFQCKNLDILVLSILLHDAGKVKEGDHCQYGAELAVAVGERLGYSEKEISLFKFLVESHILLSELSSKRDTSDPDLLQKLATVVGDTDRLHLLYVLTIIDTKSVGNRVLTNWKSSILKGLYENTLEILENGTLVSDEKSNIENLKQFLKDKERIEEDEIIEVVNFISDMIPESYLRYFTPRRIYHHYLVYSQLSNNRDIFHIDVSQEPSYLSITVYHYDGKIFLSELTGCVTSFSLNVIGLRSFRSKNGFFMESIQVTDHSGSKNIPEFRLNQLKKNLLDLHNGTLNVEDLFRHPSEWIYFHHIPEGMVEEKIEFNDDISKEYTVLEIKLPDSPGLLYRIIYTILGMGIEIHFVRVSTSADYAYDTFYLKNSLGKKISDPEILKSVRERITNAKKEKIQTGYDYIEI